MQYHSLLLLSSLETRPAVLTALQKLVEFQKLELHWNEQNPDILWIDEELSIGIARVRELIADLQQKPFQEICKVALVLRAQTLTLESQHALLKTLEEPPADTLIMLITPQTEGLLPTIVSRCQIVRLDSATTHEKSASRVLQAVLSSRSKKEVFELAEQIGSSREEAIAFVQQYLKTMQQQLEKQPSAKVLAHIKHVIQALRQLNNNCNVTLVIESMLFKRATE